MKARLVYHHDQNNDQECSYDYVDVELFLEGHDQPIASWEDAYHESDSAFHGFIKGVEWALGIKLEVTTEAVADRDAW